MVLNLSGDMQISTPHTRFFRLFYCSPKQGDIYSGINFQCQFHATNIQNISDAFKYLKNNIINIKKGKWFNSSHNLNICGYL